MTFILPFCFFIRVLVVFVHLLSSNRRIVESSFVFALIIFLLGLWISILFLLKLKHFWHSRPMDYLNEVSFPFFRSFYFNKSRKKTETKE